MAGLTATAANMLRQMSYDDATDALTEREMLRRKSEYYQGLTRALPSTVTVPTSSSSRYNKRLLLCRP